VSNSREADYIQLKKLISQDKVLLLPHKKYKGLRQTMFYARCGISQKFFEKVYKNKELVLQFREFGLRIGAPVDWQDALADYNSGKMQKIVEQASDSSSKTSGIFKEYEMAINSEIDEFETKIKDYKDDLFGITLFYQGTKLLQPPSLLKMADFEAHYKSIMDRGKTIINKAEEILSEVRTTHHIEKFREIKFPPLSKDMPPIIDNIPRLKLLIETYAELFPGRDRKIPLTERENMLIMNKVIEKF